jgi:hypothetical protein
MEVVRRAQLLGCEGRKAGAAGRLGPAPCNRFGIEARGVGLVAEWVLWVRVSQEDHRDDHSRRPSGNGSDAGASDHEFRYHDTHALLIA